MAKILGIGGVFVKCPDNGPDTDYFAPSEAPFMINLRVDDVADILKKKPVQAVQKLSVRYWTKDVGYSVGLSTQLG